MYLGEGSALTNGDLIANGNITEGGGDVGSQVAMALLITVVFGDVMKVITTDDAGTVEKEMSREKNGNENWKTA